MSNMTDRMSEASGKVLLDEGVGLARSAEKAGISWSKLLKLIVNAAMDRMPHDINLPMLPHLSSVARSSDLVVSSAG